MLSSKYRGYGICDIKEKVQKMKNFKWQIDTDKAKFNPAEKEFCSKDGQKALFESILNQALQGKHPQGMPSKDGRVLARVYSKLDAAEATFGILSLEEAEFEIIHSALMGEQAKFNPAQFRLISEYGKNIEEALK